MIQTLSKAIIIYKIGGKMKFNFFQGAGIIAALMRVVEGKYCFITRNEDLTYTVKSMRDTEFYGLYSDFDFMRDESKYVITSRGEILKGSKHIVVFKDGREHEEYIYYTNDLKFYCFFDRGNELMLNKIYELSREIESLEPKHRITISLSDEDEEEQKVYVRHSEVSCI